MKSKIIALSAISAGFIAIILTLGAYIEFFDLVSIVLASVFVILPLYLKSYLGAFLTYLAGGVIAFLFSGFNVMSLVFPSYLVFFGVFPIIRCFMADKNINKWLAFFLGLIWCVGVFYGMYFYYVGVMGMTISDLPTWITDGILYFIGLGGIVFYIIFDRFIYLARIVADRYLGRIIK